MINSKATVSYASSYLLLGLRACGPAVQLTIWYIPSCQWISLINKAINHNVYSRTAQPCSVNSYALSFLKPPKSTPITRPIFFLLLIKKTHSSWSNLLLWAKGPLQLHGFYVRLYFFTRSAGTSFAFFILLKLFMDFYRRDTKEGISCILTGHKNLHYIIVSMCIKSLL